MNINGLTAKESWQKWAVSKQLGANADDIASIILQKEELEALDNQEIKWLKRYWAEFVAWWDWVPESCKVKSRNAAALRRSDREKGA